MLTILHRRRVTTWTALPLLFAASLAMGGCSQGADPQPTAQLAAPSASGGSDGGQATPSSTANGATGDGSAATTSKASGSSGNGTKTSPTGNGKPSGEGAPPNLEQGGPRTIVINVKGKTVSPAPGSVKVKKGEPILLVVITDKDGELHIHGVDIEKETKARTATQVPLTFKQTGSFEVELHDPELLLTKIIVS